MEFGLALTAEVTISQQSEKNSKNIKNYRGKGLLFSYKSARPSVRNGAFRRN